MGLAIHIFCHAKILSSPHFPQTLLPPPLWSARLHQCANWNNMASEPRETRGGAGWRGLGSPSSQSLPPGAFAEKHARLFSLQLLSHGCSLPCATVGCNERQADTGFAGWVRRGQSL